MILYDHPFSYAQKVKIALREKCVAFERALPKDFGTGRRDTAFAAAIPRAEVQSPAGVDDPVGKKRGCDRWIKPGYNSVLLAGVRKQAVFFEKKEPKTFVPSGMRRRKLRDSRDKSLLLLFFRKEGLCLAYP